MMYSCLFVLMSVLCAIDAAGVQVWKTVPEQLAVFEATFPHLALKDVADRDRTYCKATKPLVTEIGNPTCIKVHISKLNGTKAEGSMTLTNNGTRVNGSPMNYTYIEVGKDIQTTVANTNQTFNIQFGECPDGKTVITILYSNDGTSETIALTLSTEDKKCNDEAVAICLAKLKTIWPVFEVSSLSCP